ncbi:MAG: fatty-acid oxidation protein subunit alpha [Bacteroidetes bacterium]|nr:fatty-acid oxidation protein subunit alpha [Bacteroidota bacterium]
MARDKFHYEFRHALESEGWTVTDDPLYLKIGKILVHIDLGAERLIAAERQGEKIAIEIKTFGNASFITALYEAVGKYIVYRKALELLQPERSLYLAIPVDTYLEFHKETVVKDVFEEQVFKIVLYDPDTEKIVSWIK